MEAKDGSSGFDFNGTYTAVESYKKIEYEMERAPEAPEPRRVSIEFTPQDEEVEIVEVFDAETQNPEEMQRQGWQNILDNFKRYVESN